MPEFFPLTRTQIVLRISTWWDGSGRAVRPGGADRPGRRRTGPGRCRSDRRSAGTLESACLARSRRAHRRERRRRICAVRPCRRSGTRSCGSGAAGSWQRVVTSTRTRAAPIRAQPRAGRLPARHAPTHVPLSERRLRRSRLSESHTPQAPPRPACRLTHTALSVSVCSHASSRMPGAGNAFRSLGRAGPAGLRRTSSPGHVTDPGPLQHTGLVVPPRPLGPTPSLFCSLSSLSAVVALPACH